ncbi:MAG: hypothetical protein J07HQX50_00289 [Haloquadratum sp. J07HQX50]|nr:MAG: hypothetical protein J07HQX50_00289 [Haloquadratum sp. J07HQX50]
MVSFEFDIVDKYDDDRLVKTAVTLSFFASDELFPQLSQYNSGHDMTSFVADCERVPIIGSSHRHVSIMRRNVCGDDTMCFHSQNN